MGGGALSVDPFGQLRALVLRLIKTLTQSFNFLFKHRHPLGAFADTGQCCRRFELGFGAALFGRSLNGALQAEPDQRGTDSRPRQDG